MRQQAAVERAEAHRAGVATAQAELQLAAIEMRSALSRAVALETASVLAEERQAAFRARCCGRLLLQRHRPTLAKCYQAWRELAAETRGVNLFARHGPCAALTELGRRASEGEYGGGVSGEPMPRSMQATLAALEKEWREREAEAQEEREHLLHELGQARAEARRAGQEAAAARAEVAAKDEQLSAWREDSRAAAAVANQAARRAEAELAAVKERAAKAPGGEMADAVRLRVEVRRVEAALSARTAELEAAREAYTQETNELRTEVRRAELMRLGSIGGKGSPGDEEGFLIREAAGPAVGEVDALRTRLWQTEERTAALLVASEAAKAEAERSLEEERAARREESETAARNVDALTAQLHRARRGRELGKELDAARLGNG